MSIIASAAATTQPADENLLRELLVFLLAVLPGIGVLWLTRAYRPRSVAGPLRVPPGEPLWPVPVAIVAAVLAMLAASLAYGTVIAARQMATAPATQPGAESAAVAVGQPTAADLVVLSATAPVVSFAAGLAFLVLLRPAAPRWLGLSFDRLPGGMAAALLAAVFAVPATFLVSLLTELTYRAVGYQHPPEHELLKSMKEAASPALKWTGIAAAVIVAPLVEEFIFRGLLQTSLATWFVRLGRRPQPPGFPVVPRPYGYPAAGGPPAVLLPSPGSDPYAAGRPEAAAPSVLYAPPPPETAAAGGTPASPPPAVASSGGAVPDPVPPAAYDGGGGGDERRPRWVQSWLAVVVTSVLFAVVHPLWTAPIIFFLSLVLGYVYERTGNLWAAVGLHAVFNAISTLYYLVSPPAN